MVWLLYAWLDARAENQVRLGDDRASRELDRLRQQLRQVPLVAGYMLSRIPGEPRDDTLRRHRQEAERAATSGLIVGPFLSVCVVAGAALVLLLIGINVFRDPPGMTVGVTVVLGSSLLVAFFPARRLNRLRAALPLAERAAAAIFAYLDREPGFAEVAGARPVGRIREKVELQSITLADRQGRKLLGRVSLTIPAATKTAIVASNSTVPIALAGLLARFYDPAAGQILFDGQDIRRATLQSVRQQASVVTGEAQLFSGTVSENIACGEDRFTQLQITDAAKQARAYNFIQQLPQGFATIVGPQGHRLDAGQAFRIALARVALRDPSLVVIQEPQAALEKDAEGHIDEALRRMAQERAVVLLPTRLETLRSADRVVLLHQGEIVGEGTHPELIQASELYRHLTYVRFNPYRGQVDAT
jgi:ABC-type multidrug transport system fused ATPase/permease subunit